MSRYFLSTIAVLTAIACFAFRTPINSNANTKDKNFTTLYWQYSGSGSPLDISSYTQLTNIPGGLTAQQQYNNITCGGSNAMCAMKTNTASPTFTNDGNGFPAVSGGVLDSQQKQ